MQAHRVSTGRFASFSDFLKRTEDEDREFLAEEDLNRFPAVCCGMANGAGGWIVLGATWDEEGPEVRGLSDPSGLDRRLRAVLAGERTLSSDTVLPFLSLEAEGLSLLIARVNPVEWHRRPVCVGNDYLRGVYRRVEGIDLISGRRTRFRLALDALERLRSDSPVPGLTLADLHEESVASYRDAVLVRRAEWRALATEAFLERCLILSGGVLTQAGHLLLGRKGTRVRTVLRDAAGEEEIFEVRNLWRAYSDLLPRACGGLSDICAAALRECFVNALIHAEHDGGFVRMTVDLETARVENPGLPRTSRRGESLCRNVRLMRMFRLAGVAGDEGGGLARVRAYRPDFELHQDILELTTVAELKLKRTAGFSSPAPAMEDEVRSLPLVPVETQRGERDRRPETVRDARGKNPEETSSPEPVESAFVASASEFLVAAPSDGAVAADALPEEPCGGDDPSESPAEVQQESAARAEQTMSGPDMTVSAHPGPEADEPVLSAPEEERGGKRFPFGNAAEDLELAVAEIRRRQTEERSENVPEFEGAEEDRGLELLGLLPEERGFGPLGAPVGQ